MKCLNKPDSMVPISLGSPPPVVKIDMTEINYWCKKLGGIGGFSWGTWGGLELEVGRLG